MQNLLFHLEISKNGLKTFYGSNQVSKIYTHLVTELKTLEPLIGQTEIQTVSHLRWLLKKIKFNESLKKKYNNTVVIITKVKYN